MVTVILKYIWTFIYKITELLTPEALEWLNNNGRCTGKHNLKQRKDIEFSGRSKLNEYK